ncbi:MAG: PAS domain-containing sensor histidine kinase [Acidimicrobiia bacterium]|nr:PAS domain-containing sensor histidine kinase [Acidimicrobiia bacterium]
MESHVAETLLGSPNDMARLHRRVIRIGAAAAWVISILFVIAAGVTGNTHLYLEGAVPALIGTIMTAQAVLGREDAGWALFIASAIVIASVRVLGTVATILPAALGVVIVASVGMLFVRVHQFVVTIITGGLLIGVPFFWGLPAEQAVSQGLVMAVSFAVSTAIFRTVGNAATSLNHRFQVLFEHSPTAVLEADWSAALAYLQSEFSGKRDRIRGFLGAYPDIVSKAASLVEVIRANQAALDLLNVREVDQILGSAPEGRLPPQWVEAYAEVLIALYEGRRFTDHEFRAPAMDGRDIWLNARFVDASGGEKPDGVLIALADITHLKAKEDAMHDLIRSKDEFVASISHELRTPLTAVVGLTSEMTGGDLSDADRDELTQLVAGQAREMSHIIDDLLVAARTEIGTVSVAMSDIDLIEQLNAAVESVGVNLEEAPQALPAAIGDGARVRQILRNLLTNVERYGGGRRRVLGGVDRSRVWLEVRDNGEGVSEEDAERIFEAYASAHSGVASSVGLGLSVARQLAQLMGGTLTYRRDGTDSVFRLELGLAEESLLV